MRTIVDTARDGGKTRVAAGLNRFNWDLRSDPVPNGRGHLIGPKATPGTYHVKLAVGTSSQTATLNVLMDPRLARIHVTTQDLQQQADMLAQIRGGILQVQRAAATARERRSSLAQSAGGQADVAAALSALERELVGAADEGRGGRGGAGRGGAGRGGAQPLLAELTSLYNFVSESEDKPTAAAAARWTELKRSLDEKVARINAQAAPPK
jgi:hypothetical protein